MNDLNHAEDVAAASAAYVTNVMPEISKLPAPEFYQRLREIFLTAILAYCECRQGWGLPPEPSNN